MATRIIRRLPTALQIATAKAKVIRAAEWASRLDADAYDCHRDGSTWIAEGPAGQRFEFSKTSADDVLVMSQSGGLYLIGPSELTGELVCDCPAHKSAGTCKHLVAFEAVKCTHRAVKRAQQPATEPAPSPSEALYNVVHVAAGRRTVMLEGLTLDRIQEVYPFALAGECEYAVEPLAA
jgi:hypothetical protein